MIRPLDDKEMIALAKLRLSEPYKCLYKWLFSWDNISEDFEYLFDIKDDAWYVILIKVIFSLPIYFIVILYKIVEFLMIPFNVEEWIERFFEFMCCTVILTIFGTIRLPFAIYTYVRFSRANALLCMIKSD